ncbi:glycoside hydrolase family 114 protein [Mycena amicta]|nr:glycoside hydrolase family 114 protein [Mycena amicta]
MLNTSVVLSIVALVATAIGAAAAPSTVTLFDPAGDFDYQLGGSFTPVSSVTTVSRDKDSEPVDGLYNICYINAFQSQTADNTWWNENHPDLLLQSNGKPLLDPDWDEYIFNTTTEANRNALAAIVEPWIDSCASKGFDAIEPDNLDSYTRFSQLTKADNLAFAKVLSDYAHSKNLAFAQKNTADLKKADMTAGGFDFAIAEECAVYDECDSYTNLYGNHVLEIEYSDNGLKYYTKACAALGAQIPITYRDRDVTPTGIDEHC